MVSLSVLFHSFSGDRRRDAATETHAARSARRRNRGLQVAVEEAMEGPASTEDGSWSLAEFDARESARDDLAAGLAAAALDNPTVDDPTLWRGLVDCAS